MKEKSSRIPQVAHEILAYLLRNPAAKDTLEGIVNWWLLEQDIQRNVALVKRTVEELTVRGFLLAKHGNDSKTYYSVNPDQISEISAIIVKK